MKSATSPRGKPKAVASLTRGLALNPNDVWDRYNLSLALWNTKIPRNRIEALVELNKVVSMDGNFRKFISSDPQFREFRKSPEFDKIVHADI
jgi:hypothetical protein